MGILIALVVGCAACIWEDVKAAQSLCDFDAVYCVKQAGVHWPWQFKCWPTLHPEFMDAFENERRALGHPGGYEIVAPLVNETRHGTIGNIARRISYRWPGMSSSAFSGIFGAKVALDDGYNVILAGIPMDANVGHFLPGTRDSHGLIRGDTWPYRDECMPGFNKAVPFMVGRVKSMSGHTRSILGAPTPEWLAGLGDPNQPMGEMPEQKTARG